MSDTPEEGVDVSRQGRFNGIVIAILVAVGLLGAVAMFFNLNPSGSASKPAPQPVDATRPAAAPSGAGRHALQLPPFADVATAEDLRAKLEKLGIPASVRIEAHLLVGPFATPEEQEAARAKLKELGVYGAQPITLKQ